MRFYEDFEKYGNNIAVINSSAIALTYGELAKRCDRFSAAINSNNKKLIFILCSNNIESLTAYLGTLRANHTAFLLPSNIDDEMLCKLSELYQPDYIWRDKSETGNEAIIFEDNNYILIEKGETHDYEINPGLSLLLSTSGSTGSPKTVRLSGNNLEANASSISKYLKLKSEDRPITSLPMNYSYGLSVINSFLKVGGKILLTDDSIVTRSFWDMFKKYEATTFSGVPFTYEMLRRFKFFKMDLPSLQTITQAGGKLSPELVKELAEYAREKKIDFFVMYGQTEATARISYLPPENNLNKYKSIGIAIPDGELSLRGKDGNKITEAGVDGELVYRGPNVMLGYAEGFGDLGRGDDLKGLLFTGDIAQMDDDGYFYITGRMKRFIKLFGNRVNLDEVEQFLRSRGHTVVCGGQDESLCIATTSFGSESKIKKSVVEKYAFHHSAIKVIAVTEIARNDSGKILYEQMFEGILT